jgi:hypothetical protein
MLNRQIFSACGVAACAAAVTLGGATTAQAATTYDGSTIRGLDVGGTLYDVELIDGTYNDIFGTTLPTFLGSSQGASNYSTQ